MKRKNILRLLLASGLSLGLVVGLYVAVSLGTRAATVDDTAIVTVSSGKAYQSQKAEVRLFGFGANETVTLWQTFPNYKVLPLGEFTTNGAGEAVFNITMDASQPVGRHAMSAHGNTSDILAIGEFELLAQEPPTAQAVTIDVKPINGDQQGHRFSFRGTGYKTSEPVSLWLTRPDGSVVDLGIVNSSSERGGFEYSYVSGPEDPEGVYHITGYGRSSETTGIGSFKINRGDYLGETEAASLEIEPAQVRQLDNIVVTGSGFEPGELIGLWLTLPDGSVVTLYSGVTMNGSFRENIYLPAVIPEGGLPIGTHDFTAYGDSSGKRAIAPFEILPGSGM